MQERYIDRKRALGLLVGAAATVLLKEPKHSRTPQLKPSGTTISAAGSPTRLYLQEIATAGIDSRYDGMQTTVIPGASAGDPEPAPPQQKKEPEYRKQTAFIAEKPVWTKDYMSSKKTGVIKRIDTTKPLIAITIDDGFSKEAIKKILEIAKAKKITWTDFMKGLQREMYPELVKQIMESELSEPGSHTQVHRTETNGPVPGIPPTRDDLTTDISTPELFVNKFGFTTLPYQRPPTGAVSEWTIEVSGSIGYRSILWSASADAGYSTDVRSLVPGDIVLMHYRDDSAAQFAGWIDKVRARGLEPTALSNVFAVEGQ